MYGIPKELDLSSVLGEFTTQLRVGQFDLQFTFGPVDFAVQSPVQILREGEIVARWSEGTWPDSGFYEIMNVNVASCEIVGERQIVLQFENGLSMLLEDNSDQYESMTICFKGDSSPWII